MRELANRLRQSSYRLLENRMVFDGAAVDAAVDIADAGSSAENGNAGSNADQGSNVGEVLQALAQAPAVAEGARSTIVFIDSRVQDQQVIAEAVPEGAEVVFLSAHLDGVEQVQQVLADRSDIAAVHLVSHGEVGEIYLGTSVLNSSSISEMYAGHLGQIGAALSGDGDILIYGCDVAAGSEGQAFIHALSSLTGADVAASTDRTGASESGADWDLEAFAGAIEAQAIAASGWGHTLAASLILVADDGGNDDESDQNDLTALAVDYSNVASGEISVAVQIDPTTNSGSNTSNIAIVFDTDGDTDSNYGFAISLGGSPTFSVELFSLFYGAADNNTNKISGSQTTVGQWIQGSGWQAGTVVGTAGLQTTWALDTTAADPFDASNDTRVTLTIDLDDILDHWKTINPAAKPAPTYGDIKLVNATTQPSHSASSAPKDIGISVPPPYNALDDATSTNEDSPVTLNVAANDSLGLAPSTVELNTGPSNGAVTVGVNGIVTYTPASGFSGTDTFTYDIYGLDGAARTATVTVTVIPINHTPIAVNDAFSVSEQGTLSDDVKTNDTGLNDAPLTFTNTTSPTNGTLIFRNDGTFTYAPNTDFYGTDTFDYRVTDGDGDQSTATVTITVDPVNDPPVNTLPVSYAAQMDTPLVLTGLSIADIDAGTGTMTVQLTVVDGSLSAVGGGAVAVAGSPGKTITLTGTLANINGFLAGASRPTYTPLSGSIATDTLTMTTSDGGNTGTGNVLTDIDSVSITINAVPEPKDPDPTPGTPFIDGDDVKVPAVDDVLVSIDLDDYYRDANGDTLAFTVGALPSWLSYNGTTHVLSGRPPVDNVGDHAVAVTVSDGKGGVLNSQVIIQPVNPGPTANAETTNTAFNTPVDINLAGNDTDPDNDPLSILGTPTLATPADGTLTLVAGTTYRFTPAATFSGNAVINYTIQDQDLAQSSSTHTVTVANAVPEPKDPDPTPGTPFIDGDDVKVPAVDDVLVSIDLDDYYRDANGDTLAFTVGALPSWLSYNGTTHVLSGRPPVDNVGDHAVAVTVSDGKGGVLNSQVIIQPVNPGPTANAETTNTAFNTPVDINLAGNDTDPDNDPLSILGTPTLATPADGTLTLVAGTTYRFTPAATFSGNAVINYTIQDQDLAQSSSTHTVTVANAVPEPKDPDPTPGTPFIDGDDVKVPAVDDVLVSIDLDDYYRDANGDTLAFTVGALPSWLSYNGTTHVLSGKPPVDNVGDHAVAVTVSDGKGGVLNSQVIIQPVNPGPTANAETTNTAFNTPVDINLAGNDTDPDNDPLSILGTPTLATPADGTLTLVAGTTYRFTPAATFSGNAVINYTIQDQDLAQSSSTHTVTVANAVPEPKDPDPTPGTPFIDGDDVKVPAVDDVLVSIDLDDYYRDANGDTLAFTVGALPSWLSYNGTTHVLSGRPPVDNVGDHAVAVTVSDGKGGVLNSQVIIQPVNPGPTANAETTNTAFNTPVDINLAGNDTDPDNDPLSILGTPTLATPADGTLTLVAGTTYRFTPAATFSGNAVINYTIQDQDLAQSSSTHTVTVANAVPEPKDPDPTPGTPFIDGDDVKVPAVDDVLVSIDLDDYYRDANGDTLAFTVGALPSWLSYNGTTHVLSGRPPVDNVGDHAVAVTVSDGKGGVLNSQVIIQPVNPGPTANAETTNTAFNTPVDINLAGNDTDPDNDPLSILGTPTLATPADGTLTLVAGTTYRFTPAATFSGNAVINYTIQDQDLAQSSSTHTVTVANAPVKEPYVPPVAEPSPPQTPAPAPGPGPIEPVTVDGIILDTIQLMDALEEVANEISERGIVLDTVNGAGGLQGVIGNTEVLTIADVATPLPYERAFDIWTSASTKLAEVDSNGGAWSPIGLAGSSLRLVAANSESATAADSSHVQIEALVQRSLVIVQLGAAEQFGNAGRLLDVDKSRLPAWLEISSSGVLVGKRPADVVEFLLFFNRQEDEDKAKPGLAVRVNAINGRTELARN